MLYRFLFFFYIYSNLSKQAHIYVCDECERKEGKNISSPIGKEKRVSGHQEDSYRHIMTEAIFARKQKKEFPAPDALVPFAPPFAIFMELPEELFMRDGPGYASYRYGEY